MLVGYATVSTIEQNLHLQQEALQVDVTAKGRRRSLHLLCKARSPSGRFPPRSG